MAAIIKKVKKGKPYYYAVQSKRVDGKPRIVWQKYLGTIEAIIDRTEGLVRRPPKKLLFSKLEELRLCSVLPNS